MVQNFSRQNKGQVARADREEVMPGDVSEVTVGSGSWTELFTVASTNTKRYAPGYGTGNSDGSDAGFSDFDLKDDSSTPKDVDGNYRWVLYESSDHDVPVRISGKLNSTQQRASVSESLRDKQLVPGMQPRGAQDRELVLEFKASTASDGLTISQANSNAQQGLPYSLFRV